MSDKEKKGPTKVQRCEKILVLLEERRDVLENEYIATLEAGDGVISRSTVELLDSIQELDEHIAEMNKQTK